MEETQKEIRCIDARSTEYPRRLKEFSGMPEKIYCIGGLPEDDRPTIAVVGARMCSTYGRLQAFRYAKVLSAAGVQVISGLAYGIDAEGHKGALEGHSATYAVLGNGADICYPAANRPLYQRILREQGGIISEYPRGTRALPGYFPARNRIISALADAVLVVEAKEKSGSLITAGFALDQGKTVYAVPGAVNEALSLGCHKLIYDGATIAYCPEIILSELGIVPEKDETWSGKIKIGLESDLNMVYSCLDSRPKNVDYFIRKTGFTPGKTSSILMELELRGLAAEAGRHYYVKQGGPAESDSNCE